MRHVYGIGKKCHMTEIALMGRRPRLCGRDQRTSCRTVSSSVLRPGRTWLLVCLACCLLRGLPCRADITLIQNATDVLVQIDGKTFTRYVIKSGTKPILWPIVGPTGHEMTRAFPMRQDASTLTTDHVHHRSMWFGHGDVNGKDFWLEEKNSGVIQHVEFVKVEQEPTPLIVTRNEWINDEQNKVCSDLRAVRFYEDGERRWIDFDITLINDSTEPITFGDTKEGSFGIRVADSMRVDSGPSGHIVNAMEMTNEDAWGKTAAWVDYQGTVDESNELVGIAVLNHPNSFRFPTYWHVRTYGLFAANCFGLHNFRNSRDEDGAYVLEPEQSISFFYRVVLHRGDEQQARIPESFVDYAKVTKQSVIEQLAGTRGAELPPSGESPAVDVPEVIEQDGSTAQVDSP